VNLASHLRERAIRKPI